MLLLTRRPGETLDIGDDITVTVLSVRMKAWSASASTRSI